MKRLIAFAFVITSSLLASNQSLSTGFTNTFDAQVHKFQSKYLTLEEELRKDLKELDRACRYEAGKIMRVQSHEDGIELIAYSKLISAYASSDRDVLFLYALSIDELLNKISDLINYRRSTTK